MADPFGAGEGNLFKQVLGLHAAGRRAGGRHTLSEEGDMSLFKTVRPNIVQSIRAFRVPDLAAEAERLGQHFLYANCAHAQTKAEVLEVIATNFLFPKHFGKNFDALHDCLTDLVHRAGPQPGFVVVLEGLPTVQKFDKDARETLLDVFREAAEFWAERRVSFRVFYSFA
ncbi:barnase inhibitor [Pandoraea terrae]|uniref:Barnase inhibitor n=1 Tax=Pandoraea terrae TaxID=1537710 RepID=A0A5E4YU92_9BURK|nr:barnase inhibitor [Pandoraea terrae]